MIAFWRMCARQLHTSYVTHTSLFVAQPTVGAQHRSQSAAVIQIAPPSDAAPPEHSPTMTALLAALWQRSYHYYSHYCTHAAVSSDGRASPSAGPADRRLVSAAVVGRGGGAPLGRRTPCRRRRCCCITTTCCCRRRLARLHNGRENVLSRAQPWHPRVDDAA
jgi:hypothetical protein